MLSLRKLMLRIILICNFKNEKYKSKRIYDTAGLLNALRIGMKQVFLTQLNLYYYGKYKV